MVSPVTDLILNNDKDDVEHGEIVLWGTNQIMKRKFLWLQMTSHTISDSATKCSDLGMYRTEHQVDVVKGSYENKSRLG